LRAALAARDAALNREDLAASERTSVAQSGDDRAGKSSRSASTKFARGPAPDPADHVDPASFDPSDNLKPREPSEGTASYLINLPTSPRTAPIALTPRTVPDVKGLSVREAVRALHGAGFRVRLLSASSSGTLPAAGTLAAPGTIVQLNRPLE